MLIKITKHKRGFLTVLLSAILCAAVIGVMAAVPSSVRANDAETRSPADLWTASAGVTVAANQDLPARLTEGVENRGYDRVRVTADDLEPWQKNAVMFSCQSDNNKVEFNNIIDISGFTKNDSLIEVMPLSAVNPISTFDFSHMYITFTDADNPDIWFRIHLYCGEISNLSFYQNFPSVSRMLVETCTGVNRSFYYGFSSIDEIKPDSELFDYYYQGFIMNFSPFHNSVRPNNRSWNTGETTIGEPLELADMRAMPYSVRYDVESNSIWMLRESQELLCVLPLSMDYTPDGREVMGYGKTFPGFTHNRVKMSISISGIARTPASYYVLKVANQPMNGATLADNDAPSILSLLDDDNLPQANVGMVYPFYKDVEFYDFYDGVIPYDVFVKEPGADTFSTEPVTNYIPQKEGEYVFRYQVTDRAGNKAYKDYPVFAQHAADGIGITVDEVTSEYKAGEVVPIPEAKYSGGSGALQKEVTVTRLSDGREIEIKNNAFVPMLASEYLVTYTATDYLGRTAGKTVILEIGANDAPVYAGEFKMFKKLATGERVKLPMPKAYDYTTLPGQKLNAVTEITITGQGDKSNVSETLTDGIFTPTIEKFGNKITVTYNTYLSGKPAEKAPLQKSYEVELIQPEYMWDYFIAGDNTQMGHNENGESERYISFKAQTAGDASVEFMNSLPASNCTVRFGAPNKDNFKSLVIKLTDYENLSETYELQVRNKDEQQSYVDYNGAQYAMSGVFGTNSIMQLHLVSGTVLDYMGNVVCVIGENAFPSGRLWLEITVKGAEQNAEIHLQTVGFQNMLGASYNRNGELQKFEYSVKPFIEVPDYNNEIVYGDVFKIPDVKAYDMYTLYVETTYTLYDPEGELVGTGTVGGSDAYALEKYGEYTLVFGAENGAFGGVSTVTESVFVFDRTAPIIVYKGDTTISAKAGKEITFDEIVVYDSVDEDPQYYVFVIERGIYRNITAERKFTFTKKGDYTVRYIAADASDNTSVFDVMVTVK